MAAVLLVILEEQQRVLVMFYTINRNFRFYLVESFMKEKSRLSGQKIKLQILGIIRETIRENKWSQMTAAKIIGVDQPKVSQIINGKATGFSLERLLVFLLRLRCKIKLSVTVEKLGPTHADDVAIQNNNIDNVEFMVLPKDSC